MTANLEKTKFFKALLRSLILAWSVFNLSIKPVVGQTAKEILGSFEIGCKPFNYTVKRSAKSLYSLKIEDIEKASAIVSFDNDTISQAYSSLSILMDSINVLINRDTLVPEGSKKAIEDSIRLVNGLYLSIIDTIRSNESNIGYWSKRIDSVRLIIGYAQKLHFDRYLYKASADMLSILYLEKRMTDVVRSVSKSGYSKEYVINEFNEEVVRTIIANELKKYKATFSAACLSNPDKKAEEVFYIMKSQLELKDDEPVTAYLRLKNQYIDCFYSDCGLIPNIKDTNIHLKLYVEDVAVEFEDGTIKNVFVDVKLDPNSTDLPIRFKNNLPITMSSRNDPDRLDDWRVFAGNTKELRNVSGIKSKEHGFFDKFLNGIANTGCSNGYFYFYLSDLMEYYIVAENDKEDYSPANTVVHLNRINPTEQLKKDKRSKILSVRAFADLVGIQGDQPNGLIQIEAARRFNLMTIRNGMKGINFGCLTYIEPRFSFSKIEKNNNSLPLNFSDLDSAAMLQNNKKFKVNAIDLLKYQNSAFDINLNAAKANSAFFKSNFHVNVSFGLLRSNISDTIVVSGNAASKSDIFYNNTITTFSWGPSFIWEIKPENRYGISFGFDWRLLSLLHKDYALNATSGLFSFWADAFLKTNEDSRFFFRYKLSYLADDSKSNYTQIQLGYLMDIFKVNK